MARLYHRRLASLDLRLMAMELVEDDIQTVPPL